jgi:ankyrin repeat protein
VISALLQNNPHCVDLPDTQGRTALIQAARRADVDTVRLLLEHQASINLQAKNGVTALIYASRGGRNNVVVEVVKLLLSNHANLELQDESGNTALMNACLMEATYVIPLLVQHDARIDIKNKNGEDPLAIAREREFDDILQVAKNK